MEMDTETESIGLAGMTLYSSSSDSDSDGEANARPPRRRRRRRGRGARVKCDALRRWKDRVSRRSEAEAAAEAAAAAAEEEWRNREENAIIVYRRRWEINWAASLGSFEDETSVGPMRYTSEPIPANAFPDQTLQIFSIRVRAPTDGLKWPLHVHGYVATRDTTDRRRNYLFRRTRDNCQTLTKKDPFLLLTGPSRAVVILDPITFEVELKVKGKGESEDEMLAFNVFYYDEGYHCDRRISICNPHARCTLEYSVVLRRRSVEATISIKIVEGSWPDDHQGQVVSLTSGIDEKIVLLDSGDGELPISSNVVIELSRCVVSVELGEKMLVAVDVSLSGFLARGTDVFKPENSGTSDDMIDLRSCKMQVTVAWSLLVVI